MKKLYRVGLIGVLLVLSGCGEPTQSEMKERVVRVLKQDPKIARGFLEGLDITYDNGMLVFYDHCPNLIFLYGGSLKFREECRKMLQHAANLTETIDGVKEVRVLK